MNPVWRESDLADPHAAADKASRVQHMFAAIAPSYDRNNRIHSLWRDQAWRRAAVRLANVQPGDTVIDIACGTGDLALAFARTPAARIVGLDFTPAMLALARSKSRSRPGGPPAFAAADAMCLPLPDQSCDIVSIAFGLRNVADPHLALAEFARILKPGGRLIILEFSTPTLPVLRHLSNVYTRRIMPVTASWIARDTTGAYRYLPRSVSTFLSPAATLDALRRTGFTDPTAHPLTFSIATAYRAVRPA